MKQITLLKLLHNHFTPYNVRTELEGRTVFFFFSYLNKFSAFVAVTFTGFRQHVWDLFTSETSAFTKLQKYFSGPSLLKKHIWIVLNSNSLTTISLPSLSPFLLGVYLHEFSYAILSLCTTNKYNLPWE